MLASWSPRQGLRILEDLLTPPMAVFACLGPLATFTALHVVCAAVRLADRIMAVAAAAA
jgi:hypothetical protein